jgi:hypothetical protein
VAGSFWTLGVVTVALLGALGPRVARAAGSLEPNRSAEGRSASGPLVRGLEGTWDTPLGRVHIEQTPAGYLGKLQENAPVCGFGKGAEVLRGRLTDELFTGELRVCYLPACDAPEAWLLAMAAPVEGGARLVGALVHGGAACPNFVTQGRPFAFARRADAIAPSPAGPRGVPAISPIALPLFREARALATAGKFEAARRTLERAERLDPANPELLKDIGITYYARGDLVAAEKYYLWALKVDPEFVVAHYNLACARALRGNSREALGSLRRAVELGYNAVNELNADHDLDSVRGDPAYQEILRLARANAARGR